MKLKRYLLFFSLYSFFCSNLLFAEQVIERSPGIYCSTLEAQGVSRLYRFVEHFKIDDNSMFKDGECDIFIAMLMRHNASPGCFLLALPATKDDANGYWVLSLRLLFSQYGDPGAWPLPEMSMREEYLGLYPDGLEISEKHLSYLYNSWSRYLLKPGIGKKRWASKINYTVDPFLIKSAFSYAKLSDRDDSVITIPTNYDTARDSLEQCWKNGTCLDSFFWPYSESCSFVLLQPNGHPESFFSFALDKDMIFAEGDYGGLMNIMSKNSYGHSCLIMALSSDRAVSTELGQLKRWEMALYILFNRYGERGAWPLATMELRDKFRKIFPNDYKDISEKHREYLTQAWHQYLINNSTRRVRAVWSLDELAKATKNQSQSLDLIPSPFFQYIDESNVPRMKKRETK